MFYMVGDTINIMPILMIGGYLWRSVIYQKTIIYILAGPYVLTYGHTGF